MDDVMVIIVGILALGAAGYIFYKRKAAKAKPQVMPIDQPPASVA